MTGFGSLNFNPNQMQSLFGQGQGAAQPAASGMYGDNFIGNAYDPTINPQNDNTRYVLHPLKGGKWGVWDMMHGGTILIGPSQQAGQGLIDVLNGMGK